MSRPITCRKFNTLRTFRFGICVALPVRHREARLKPLYIDLGAALAVALVLSALASGQNNQSTSRTATVMGTVTGVNGDTVPNATVVLKDSESNEPRTIVTTKTGMFE